MKNKSQSHQVEKAQSAFVSRYDGHVVGAAIFLNKSELQSLDDRLEDTERIYYDLVDSSWGTVLRITGQDTIGECDSRESISD